MKPKFMLDTDSVSYALRGQGNVAARILDLRPSELCISAITLAELRYGAALRDSKKLHALIDTFTSNVAVMPFDDSCAMHFGTMASGLAKRGSNIGDFDLLIAAHAMALDVTLVTNNSKHFTRVPRLTVDNWV